MCKRWSDRDWTEKNFGSRLNLLSGVSATLLIIPLLSPKRHFDVSGTSSTSLSPLSINSDATFYAFQWCHTTVGIRVQSGMPQPARAEPTDTTYSRGGVRVCQQHTPRRQSMCDHLRIQLMANGRTCKLGIGVAGKDFEVCESRPADRC
jgi:hypothetical protein